MKAIFLLSLAFILSGCAMHFTHPSKSQTDFKREWNDCRVKSGQAGVIGGMNQRSFMQECMEGQGWSRAE